MLKKIKNNIPQLLRKPIASIYKKSLIPLEKKIIFHISRKKHKNILIKIKGKNKIRVVFLAIHKSVWKVDHVFKKMFDDPYFEPIILVCPYTVYGEERMWVDLNASVNFFKNKGYPVFSSFNEDEKRWIALSELSADLVFFTNPHNLTRKEYYADAYLNYLSCYVPYHHEIGSGGDINMQYNQVFHNALWRIFAPHESSRRVFEKYSFNRGASVEVTGFPAMEDFFEESSNSVNPWKNQDKRLRLIWAPHHTVDEKEFGYSSFLEYCEFFKSLSLQCKNEIYWCFKPHPILKSKLYELEGWGIEKTNEYYDFWEKSEFSQLNDGEYFDLFKESDAMIHDCGSFLAEYLYVKKPVMYLISEDNFKKSIDGYTDAYYNEFGLKALSSCRKGYSAVDINNFIKELLGGMAGITEHHVEFLEFEIYKYFVKENPSDRILNSLRKDFFN